MNIEAMSLDRSITANSKISGLVTEKQFNDPQSFDKRFVDDVVSVKAPSGAVANFRVSSISDNGGLMLGPVHPKTKIGGRLNSTIIVAQDFHDSKTGFKAKKNELVMVGDQNKCTVKMKVASTIDGKYLLLSLPGAKPIGLFGLLKILWNIT